MTEVNRHLFKLTCLSKILFNESIAIILIYKYLVCPVSWNCGIRRLHLCRRVPPTSVLNYDTKQSDSEVLVM